MVTTRDSPRRVARRADGRDATAPRILSGDRVAIFGRSGTGKTTLLRHIVRGYPRAIALDPKRRLWLPGDWQPLEGTKAAVVGWPTGWPRVIARPAVTDTDLGAWLNACCRRAYQVTHCALAVDELAGVATASRPAEWLDRCQTWGRELGITTVIVSQRPRRIPLTVLSEAEHVFCFGLNTAADRDYVGDTIGVTVPPADKHGCWYWRPDLDRAVEYGPLPL